MNGEMTSNLPRVDIVMSTYNEGSYIEKCLEHVLGQDYPPELLRVWLVDGGSTDATVAVASARAIRDSRLTVLTSGGRVNLPEALNMASKYASAEIVAKIDAHGYPENDYISRAVEALMRDATVACVGGRPVQQGDTRFGEAVACARGSRIGVGGSEYGGATDCGYVDTVQCGVYRRNALDAVGWFDPTMNFGEDDELNWRLTERGYRILLDTRIRFHYVTRPTWQAAYRQYRNYGRARVMVVRKHPRYLRVYHLVPAAFFLALAALLAAAPYSVEARYTLAAVVGAYVMTLAAEAGRLVGPRLSMVPLVVGAFLSLHLGYAVGMVKEAAAGLRRLVTSNARRPAVGISTD